MGLLKNVASMLFGNRKIVRETPISNYNSSLKRRLYDLDKVVGGFIPLITNNIAPSIDNPTGYTHITERIKFIDEMMLAYDTLMQEAQQDRALYEYYYDYWNHCHNSKNNDFSLIEKYLNLREELVSKRIDTMKWEKAHDRDVIGLDKKILSAIDENQGILQTDLVKSFPESVKVDIRNYCWHFEKNGIIDRVKQGRTYALFTK